MSKFTRIVRPNESVDISPPKIAPSPAPAEKPTVTLVFGENGAGRVMPGGADFNRTLYQDKRPREELGGARYITNADLSIDLGT